MDTPTWEGPGQRPAQNEKLKKLPCLGANPAESEARQVEPRLPRGWAKGSHRAPKDHVNMRIRHSGSIVPLEPRQGVPETMACGILVFMGCFLALLQVPRLVTFASAAWSYPGLKVQSVRPLNYQHYEELPLNA